MARPAATPAAIAPAATPRHLLLPSSAPARELVCRDLLRDLPGRRLVYRATLGERAAIAKLFLGQGRRARRDFRNEALGLLALSRAGVLSPELLYAGADEGGKDLVIVTSAVTAVSLEERIQQPGCDRSAVRSALIDLVARLHQAGIRLLDPHLGNFLWDRQSHIHCVDGGSVKAGTAPVKAYRAWRELALTLAQFPQSRQVHLAQDAKQYAAARGWPPKAVQTAWFARLVDGRRRRRLRRYLGKIFRDCSEFGCLTSPCWRIVWRRDADGATLGELLADPEQAIRKPTARVLKNGNSATVVLCPTPSGDLVVKRYNIKNRYHAWRRALQPTRAARYWRGAHQLRMHGIATPQAVALVEERLGPLRGRSFLVSRYGGSVTADQYFMAWPWSPERQRLAGQLVGLLASLYRLRLSHGDLKASNFLVADGRISVLDLEAMRSHRSATGLHRAFARDIGRFLDNWRARSEVAEAFAALLLQQLPELRTLLQSLAKRPVTETLSGVRR